MSEKHQDSRWPRCVGAAAFVVGVALGGHAYYRQHELTPEQKVEQAQVRQTGVDALTAISSEGMAGVVLIVAGAGGLALAGRRQEELETAARSNDMSGE